MAAGTGRRTGANYEALNVTRQVSAEAVWKLGGTAGLERGFRVVGQHCDQSTAL
jgi:hypothetical protein